MYVNQSLDVKQLYTLYTEPLPCKTYNFKFKRNSYFDIQISSFYKNVYYVYIES